MEKNKNLLKKFMSVVLFILLVVQIGSFCFADAPREYSMEGYKINAVIDKDGNIHVREDITHLFSGQFNGVLRDIKFAPADKITLHKVMVTYEDGSKKDILSSAGSYENNSGTIGTYTNKNENGTLFLKIFEPSGSDLKTVTYEFTLFNVVTVYDDIAEFNWKMIGESWDPSISDIEIVIDIPEGALKDDLRVWAHGPLEGNKTKVYR